MGNCFRKESSTQWGGDDWGSFGSSNKTRNLYGEPPDFVEEEEENLLEEIKAGTEVKMKISRKELENLLNKTEFQGFSVQQVLAQLMSASDRFEAHQRSWRPVLHSIAE